MADAEMFEAIKRAILLVSDGGVKKIEGEGWKVYFIPGGEHGTIRVDIDRGDL